MAFAGQQPVGMAGAVGDDDGAQRLYKRIGFRATGRRQPAPGKTALDEREMARDIEPRDGTSGRRSGGR